jgi:hypothetical protein
MHAQIFSENFMMLVFEIPAFSATSRMVKQQLERITFQTSLKFSLFFYVEGRPECLMSSLELGPL